MLYRTRQVVFDNVEKGADLASELTKVTVGDKFYYLPTEFFEMMFEELGPGLQADLGSSEGIVDAAGFDLSWCKSVESRNLINEMLAMEAITTDNTIDGPSWMFKPYPISTFGKLLTAAIEDMHWTWNPGVDEPAPRFLEVGCGPGTKLVIAEKVFGLDAGGFDYNSDYVRDANELLQSKGCKGGAFLADARTVNAPYNIADVIWLNRPFVHLELTKDLEKMVLDRMHPGAYIVLGNYACDPEKLRQLGWQVIAEDKVAIVLRKPVLK
jgi:hypothetical protein